MKHYILTLIAMVLIASGCTDTGKYEGYRVIEKKFVKEVNAECVYLEHVKSGARVFKIVTDDANKTFSIAFKTPPESDCGTPHIMEHSVLNGSESFPVKSPFDILMQGSLNTFLNAMTGPDMTIYPVASMNMKDYFNLMHVYMDAVFKPLIYTDPRILAQEGWHYELTGENDPLIYKGVVYNEMKGSYSNPFAELRYQVNKALFPESPYKYSSGGYPSAIPDLTYEDFLGFHKKYYDPSNSYILLYGDADLAEELAFIDQKYLSGYTKPETKVSIPYQQPFGEMVKLVAGYPVLEGTSTAGKSYLQLSFVTPDNSTPARQMAFDILTDILVNNESGPVKKALQEAGIGMNYSSYAEGNLQTVVNFIAQDANGDDLDRFHEVITGTLKKVVEEGLDKKAVEGAINRMEFQLREGNSPQKGLTYNFQMLAGWMHNDNPFIGLEFEKPLKEIKKALTTEYMEELISAYLLNNTHALLIALVPEPGMQQKIDAEARSILETKKASLTTEEKADIMAKTEELIAYQQRSDTPEAIATIPSLALSDIEKEAKWYEATSKEVGGVKVIHYNDFTNGIVYNRLLFDARVLPQEKIGYAYLITRLVGKLSSENLEFGELDNDLNINTGGFSSGLSVYNGEKLDKNLLPYVYVESKVVADKLNKMFELTGEILIKQILDDKERVSTLLTRHYSDMGVDVENNGLAYANRRLYSYFSNTGTFNELTRGLEYYWFLGDLVKRFETNGEDVIAELKEVAAMLFVKENMIAAVTCNDADFTAWSAAFTEFLDGVPAGSADKATWAFKPEKKNEGMLTTSKVQYVVQGYNYKDLGYDWNGKFNVLNQILSTNWLQTQVRVIGGAYGGFSGISQMGNMMFASYRDPNLKETLEAYQGTIEFLNTFEADETAMTRYIIGTIANMEGPETASMKGTTSLQRYMEGTTAIQHQADKDAVLSTTAADIAGMSEMIAAILDKGYYTVYGNKEKVEANKALFMNIISPKR